MARTEAGRSSSEVARSYFEAVAARDVERMLEHWDPAGGGYIHGMVDIRVPDSYRGWFADFFRSFPDLRFDVLDIVAAEDQAVVRWHAAGTFDGPVPFEGLNPTGARIEAEGCDVLTIRDGRIVSIYAYTNAMDIARQLGAMPPRESLADRAMTAAVNLRTRAARLLRRG